MSSSGRRGAVIAALMVAACGGTQESSEFTPGPERPTVRRSVSTEIAGIVPRELQRMRSPGAVVAMVEGDSVDHLSAYSVLRGEADHLVTEDAVFQLAPVTTLVNALAATHLAATGALDLDAPLSTVAPELPDALHELTVAQLLTHTAGLAAVPAVAGRTDEDDLFTQVHYLNHYDLFTQPASIYSYSGPGVALAAHVMAEAHGKPYPETVDDLVFEPLGMTRTTLRYPGDSALTPIRVMEMETGLTPALRPLPPESALAVPVRGLYGTVPEVADLVRAVLNDGVLGGQRRLPPGVVEAALRPRVHTPDGRPVSLAGTLTHWEGRRQLEYTPRQAGHAVELRVLPDDGIGIVLAVVSVPGRLARLPEYALRRRLGIGNPTWPLAFAPPDPEEGPAPFDPADVLGEYWNGGERVALFAGEDGSIRLESGPMRLDVEWGGSAYHALLPDGRSALAFQVVSDDRDRLYLWIDDRALARDQGS